MLHSNHKIIKKYCKNNYQDASPFLRDVFLDYKINKSISNQDCDYYFPKTKQEFDSLELPKHIKIATIDNINEINKKLIGNF